MGNIYLIRNDTNNDIYIGKTTKTIKERFNQHLYNAKKYTEIQTHLYRAIRKYGDHNFSVSPLEENISSDILNEKERYWISELKPSYNMTDGGDGGLTFSITEEYRKKVSEKYSGSGNPMFGKTGKLNPNYGKIYGPNPKISKALKNPCVCDNIHFSSIGEAEEYFRKNNIQVSVRKRLDSPHHPNWFRLKPKTNR